MMRVIVFGNDHTNTVGVIQSLSMGECEIRALLFGDKTGLVKSSSFVSVIYTSHDAESCVKLLLDLPANKTLVSVLPCCDSAALALDKYREQLQEKNYITGACYTETGLSPYFEKDLQVKLAKDSGLFVPETIIVNDETVLYNNTIYPCLIKPLVSCLGSKSQIRICRNQEELIRQYQSIANRPKIILQQYIERDYEISILGCGLTDGTCIIPAVEDKLTLYPKYVGLECLAYIHPLEDKQILEGIRNLIKSIGYVGLFSVEMMHSKNDNRFYFTEINLRNDGAQSFIEKYGVNLPLIHVHNLFGLPLPQNNETHPGYYIWDMHHLKSLMARDISIVQWLKEIKESKGFLMYNSRDKMPFFRQYLYMLIKMIKCKKVNKY